MLTSANLSRDPGGKVGIFRKVLYRTNNMPKGFPLTCLVAEIFSGGHMAPLMLNRLSKRLCEIGLSLGEVQGKFK